MGPMRKVADTIWPGVAIVPAEAFRKIAKTCSVPVFIAAEGPKNIALTAEIVVSTGAPSSAAHADEVGRRHPDVDER